MTSERYPTATEDEREAAISASALALQRGDLAVIPTDTVYGIAADAFDPDAVALLLAAKGRGREMPPPVLVSSASTIDALAVDIPDWCRTLVEAFWPGPLTVVCRQQDSLQWDLGDTRGTVAVRMPDLELTRDIIDRTGPLAVSSANLTGSPAATDADQAEDMLGEKVDVIVDAGESPGGVASTIVDATSADGRILRAGALSVERLNEALASAGRAFTDDGMVDVEVPVEVPVEAGGPDEPGEPVEAGEPAEAGEPVEAGESQESGEPEEPVAATPTKRPTTRKAPPRPAARAAATPAEKTPAKKTPAKKTAATKASKKTTAKKTAAKKTAAKKAPAKKTPEKRTTVDLTDQPLFESDE